MEMYKKLKNNCYTWDFEELSLFTNVVLYCNMNIIIFLLLLCMTYILTYTYYVGL